MPEESTTPDLLDVLRRAIEAANSRDLDALTSFYAPDAVWDVAGWAHTRVRRRSVAFLGLVGRLRGVRGRAAGDPGPRQRSGICRGRPARPPGWQHRPCSAPLRNDEHLGGWHDRATNEPQ